MGISASPVKEGEYYYIPPKEVGLIDNMVPYEIFVQVLSYLDMKNMQSTVVVNNYWNRATIDVAARNELSKVEDFANQFLVDNLGEEYTFQKISSASPKGTLKVESLKQIQSYVSTPRESVINLLQGLQDNRLKNLKEKYFRNPSKDENTNTLLKNIFACIEIYEQLEVTDKISNEFEKSWAFRNISKELMEIGMIDKAIEAADKIPEKSIKSWALKDISKKLLKIKMIDKAIEAADKIPKKFMKSWTFEGIAKSLTLKDCFFPFNGRYLVILLNASTIFQILMFLVLACIQVTILFLNLVLFNHIWGDEGK